MILHVIAIAKARHINVNCSVDISMLGVNNPCVFRGICTQVYIKNAILEIYYGYLLLKIEELLI